MDERLELESISANVGQSLGRRLVLWAVRWIIGFALEAVARAIDDDAHEKGRQT